MNRTWRVVAGLVVVLALLVLIGPFLVPVPALQGTKPVADLADQDSRFVTIDGLDVHYKTSGQGEPVLLLLHGFASNTFTWREVMGSLSEIGTVVAFDRPSSGLTERPLAGEWEGSNPYTRDAQADLTVATMEAVGAEDAVLVGNSAGGTIAALTALRHPERARALVLVDAAIYDGGGAPSWVRPLLQTPQMRRLGPLVARVLRNQGERLLGLAWHDPSRITADIERGYAAGYMVDDWDKALWEFTLASSATDLSDRLDELTLPVLVITGDDDRIVPTDLSIRLAGELPNAQLVVIDSCGHVPQEECPEAFLEAVTGFVRSLR